MHEKAPTRRLLMVDPGNDCHALIPVLQTDGWAVDTLDLETALDLSGEVGLIRLLPVHFDHLEVIRELISRTRAQWVAVLAPEDLRREKIGDFVCEWCFDFHVLPLDVTQAQATLGRAFDKAHGSAQSPCDEQSMLGESRPVRDLRRLLGKLAPTDSPVLIRGERGTGRELVARTLHLQSQRRDKPFVAVNCSAIAEHLIDAELFGHESGGFSDVQLRKTGRIEAANGGTLYLDDIGDLPLEVQARLLRFMQDRTIERVGGTQPIVLDVRVLVATHVDLEAAIRKKRFREDLYYRLNVLQVGTAPLRERLGDLAMLANHFARVLSHESGRRARSFSQDALIAMGKHDWTGNVRELANRVRRGLALAEGKHIEAADLGLLGEEDRPGILGTLDDYKSRAERQALCDVLSCHSNNLSVAARKLGISRPTFYRLLHKHGMVRHPAVD